MTDAECDEPMCCRKPLSHTSRILDHVPLSWKTTRKYVGKVFNHSREDRGAGLWGDYRNCDLPWWTFEHLLHNISGKTIPFMSKHSFGKVTPMKFEYIIWGGDGIAHNVWDNTKEEVIELSRYISASFLSHFPNTSIIPVLGNHDTFPSNNFPPSDVEDKTYSVDWLYRELGQLWKPWLTSSAIKVLLEKSALIFFVNIKLNKRSFRH